MSSPTAQIDSSTVTKLRINTGDTEPTPEQDAIELVLDHTYIHTFTINDFNQFVGGLQLAAKQAQTEFEERAARRAAE